mmetsp:Transcript_28799/g.63071  ORF Transcript_28799/g.63071 Transcript_28799/m.63071 type:complete len:344 (+) Transcript_28799:1419-2450(+)
MPVQPRGDLHQVPCADALRARPLPGGGDAVLVLVGEREGADGGGARLLWAEAVGQAQLVARGGVALPEVGRHVVRRVVRQGVPQPRPHAVLTHARAHDRGDGVGVAPLEVERVPACVRLLRGDLRRTCGVEVVRPARRLRRELPRAERPRALLEPLVELKHLRRARRRVRRHHRRPVRHRDVVQARLQRRHLDEHGAVLPAAPRERVVVVREGGTPHGDAVRRLEELHVHAVRAHAAGGHQLLRVHPHLHRRVLEDGVPVHLHGDVLHVGEVVGGGVAQHPHVVEVRLVAARAAEDVQVVPVRHRAVLEAGHLLRGGLRHLQLVPGGGLHDHLPGEVGDAGAH